jgi:hypothetical protein
MEAGTQKGGKRPRAEEQASPPTAAMGGSSAATGQGAAAVSARPRFRASFTPDTVRCSRRQNHFLPRFCIHLIPSP